RERISPVMAGQVEHSSPVEDVPVAGEHRLVALVHPLWLRSELADFHEPWVILGEHVSPSPLQTVSVFAMLWASNRRPPRSTRRPLVQRRYCAAGWYPAVTPWGVLPEQGDEWHPEQSGGCDSATCRRGHGRRRTAHGMDALGVARGASG